MKKLLYLLFFLVPIVCLKAQPNPEIKLPGEAFLREMHAKYYGKYCQTIQFDQKTIRFEKNGRIIDSSLWTREAHDTTYWYEWISYPDKFRIDFGKRFGGNCVIFRNDSVFSYKDHKLVHKDRDENVLLLLLGGMYFRSYEDVMARLKRAGLEFNLKEVYIGPHVGGYKHYYILESLFGGKCPKIQIDSEDLKVTQIDFVNGGECLSIVLDEFVKTCGGFTETKVAAWKSWGLEQKEEYLNLKTSIAIPDSIFNKK